MEKESSKEEKKDRKRSRKDDDTSSREPKRSKKVTSNDKEKPKRNDDKHEKATSNDKEKPKKNKDKHEKAPRKKEKEEKAKSSAKKSNSETVKSSGANVVKGGFGWKATQPLPKRKANGVLIFEDFPDFQPNRTPKEVLQAGSFGGTYFRPIYSSIAKEKYGSEVWEELPKDWLEGLSIKRQVASAIYDEKVNKYKAKCGGSLQMWEESGWIHPQDPYGWFQWYCRFYQGRRTDDDARQVSRWWNCASVNGRWKNNLITKIHKAGAKFDNPKISPVVRQTLLHWGYELTEEDYQKRVKKIANKA